MKKVNLLLLGFLFGFLFLTTSCDDDDDPVVESEVLAEYLGEFVNTSPFPAMIKADIINTDIITNDDKIFCIDIRDKATFDAGHIENAVNVSFGELLNYYETNNLSEKETVAIVCASGQTASYGASLLRLLAYKNVKALKWGMCSWNDTTSTGWSNTIEAGNAFATQMTTDAGTKNAAGNLPTLSTGNSTGADILRTRVEAVFAASFGVAKISNQAAFDGAATNYTVNYWKQAHYDVKHIPGAVQYTPGQSFSYSQELTTLPTDRTVVVYCYTGQTSAFMAAYLRVLGYEAKTLLYGANGMMYDIMADYTNPEDATDKMTIFKDSEIHDYRLIVEN